MVRCATCGRRLVERAPVCADHGAPPPAPAREDGAPSVVATPVLPGLCIDRILGQGGFGAVFSATRQADGDQVAIKVARADQASASARLLLEAEALRVIGAPHVPAVFDAGRLEDGAVFLVMEYVRAPTLADLLARAEGAMPMEAFARHASALVRVLEAVHARGFVHCDLKPENVFVDDSFGAKLFDFGLVRRACDGGHLDVTAEEAPAGTPEYMSPEQCEGRVDLDARSDIYALGVMFYEMLCGAPPFWGNAADVQQSHRSRRPASLTRRAASVCVELEETITRCLAKDRERRIATATELRSALQAAVVLQVRREVLSVESAGAPAPNLLAGVSAPAVARPASPPRERRSVALAFFESKQPMAAIRDALTAVGAHLAHAAGAQYVAAFGHEVGDNPTRAAVGAAEMFIARGVTRRVIVDVASVSIQVRPDGARRYQSPLFARKEQYPAESDPAGVVLSAAVAEVLPDIATEAVANRPGAALVKKAQASERTTTRMGVSPLIGRDDVLRELLDGLRHAARTRTPTLTTLLGEVGYGKTHLAQMLVQHIEALAPTVDLLFLRAKEVLGGAADQTTRDLFARTLELPAEAPRDLGRGLLAERLGAEIARDTWAGVAVAMGWAQPDHPELRSLAAAPGALRSAAARAAGEALRAAARTRALALVIEDAHFVDETALDALEYATLEEASCPIWICVVARPTFGGGRTGWAGRAARRQDLRLRPLDAVAAGELARRLLLPVESVPATAISRLVERTQGIPLLLVELVRGLRRDGLVRRAEKTGTWYLATDELERLPDLPLVEWLASRETESLPPDLLAHARLASILGMELGPDELEGVLQVLERAGVAPETELDAEVGIRRLTDAGILTRHRQGRVAFRHALLRDAVYETVPPGRRAQIHRAAFEFYRTRRGPDGGPWLPQMAFHAASSGLKEEAARIFMQLAQRAMARHAYLDAELLYRRTLDNLSDSDRPAQIAATKGRGLMRVRLGRYEDAVKDFEQALGLSRASGRVEDEIDILLDEATALDLTTEWVRSASLVQQAKALAVGDLMPPPTEARLLMATARSVFRASNTNEAITTFEQAIAVAERVGEPAYESLTVSLMMLAAGYAFVGRLEEAERSFERAIGLFEEHGDMLNLAGCLSNRSFLWMVTGDLDRLVADIKRSAQIAREAGYTAVEVAATKNLAEVYYLLGRPEECEPLARRAISLATQVTGERSRTACVTRTLLGRLQYHRGDIAGTRATVAEVEALQRAARAAGDAEAELDPIDQVLLSMLGLAAEGDAGERWDELLARANETAPQRQDVIEIIEMRGITALRLGRYPEACRCLQQAFGEAEKSAPVMARRIAAELEQARMLAAS